MEKHRSLISGEVVSVENGSAIIRAGEKKFSIDSFLLPKEIEPGEKVVISVMKQGVYDASNEKKAKDLLNEILGN